MPTGGCTFSKVEGDYSRCGQYRLNVNLTAEKKDAKNSPQNQKNASDLLS